MKPLLAKLSAADATGATCCPSLPIATRLRAVCVVVTGDVEDDVYRYAETLRHVARAVMRPGGRAAQAALVEELARTGRVVCFDSGLDVDTERLAERLRRGAIWS